MFIPKIKVSPLALEYNARVICNYLSPEKARNTTLPFTQKTYSMYPELQGKLDGLSDEKRIFVITKAVEKRLDDNRDTINSRISYFENKFNSFIPNFIAALCRLFNYQWKDTQPVINCYVGYVPFYPRGLVNKWFYVSYNDEERVFSGAVHEIDHMVFYEKWKEMQGGYDMKEPSFPSALWYLTEIIVDPTLNDKSIKPFTLYENRAYTQFYEKVIEGKSIMAHVRDIYNNKSSFEEFLLKSFDFINKNIDIIKNG